MKKTPFFLLISAILFSCSTGNRNNAVLSGKVDNLTEGMFILGGPGGARDTIKTDADGRFTYEINGITEPATYYVLTKKNEFFRMHVAPGMKLDVYFNNNDSLKSLKFSGKGSDINTYLISKNKIQGDQDYEMYKLEAGAFRQEQDSILSLLQENFKSAAKDNPGNEFWKTEEAEILFGWAGNLGMYEPYHRYFTQSDEYKVPAGFDDYKAKIDINNPDYVKSQAFKSYVSNLVASEVSSREAALKQADSSAIFDKDKLGLEVAQELLKEAAVLETYLYDNITNSMQWQELSELQTMIDYFLNKCTDPELLKKFNETHASWKRLEKGQPAFDFTGRDMQGNPVKLSDFRGKYVYVDVWATWCGPCKFEIPYLDTLETDYEGKNIVFISYSIDEDHDAWMKFVPEKKLKGVQIIGEKAWESQLCKDYKIRGVPTFMFFDPEGRIISVKMTRPSDTKTREKFDSLL